MERLKCMLYTLSMPLVKLSAQRQITIPKWMLELIGARAHDKLSIKIDEGKLVLVLAKKDIIEELAGSWKNLIPKDRGNITVEEAIKKAKSIAAEHIAREGLE